jgi:hypothetical protein
MKYLYIFILLVLSTNSHAQDDLIDPRGNIIKVNLGSLAVKNFAFQYERYLGKKTSLALGIRFQPYGNIPFQSWIKDQVNDPDVQVGQMQLGNFALTPEFRYYFRESMRGFYIAPYARYASYKMETPVVYHGSGITNTANFKGDIQSISGGLLLGSQYRLGKHFTLDWWIIGAHIGSSNGELNFTASPPLTATEQADLRSTLDEVDIPFFSIEHNINANGGTITSKGAWAGFRGFALNLGFRF